jgi:hypothetical protein
MAPTVARTLRTMPPAESQAGAEKQVTNSGGGMPAFKGTLSEEELSNVARTSRKTSSAANNELGDQGPTEPWSPGWCDFRSSATWSRSVAASPPWWRRTVFPSEILIVAGGGARPLHRQRRDRLRPLRQRRAPGRASRTLSPRLVVWIRTVSLPPPEGRPARESASGPCRPPG